MYTGKVECFIVDILFRRKANLVLLSTFARAFVKLPWTLFDFRVESRIQVSWIFILCIFSTWVWCGAARMCLAWDQTFLSAMFVSLYPFLPFTVAFVNFKIVMRVEKHQSRIHNVSYFTLWRFNVYLYCHTANSNECNLQILKSAIHLAFHHRMDSEWTLKEFSNIQKYSSMNTCRWAFIQLLYNIQVHRMY